MLSRYLRTKERNDTIAIFHELHPDPIYCSIDRWRKLNDRYDDKLLIAELKSRKLIVNTSKDDEEDFHEIELLLNHKLDQTVILYLMTAQGCNLRCGYCPVPETAKTKGSSMLTTEECIAGIEIWRRHILDKYDPKLQYFIIFYGGEPLLNKNAIKNSLIYIDSQKISGRLPKEVNIMIATNGLLLDKEMIYLCAKYNVIVAVGLDGPKELNDYLRKDINGNGTFDDTISVIRQLVGYGIRICASVSITPFNIDYISCYSTLFKEIGVEKFGFNFLKGHKLLNLVGENGLDAYYRKAVKGIIENERNQNISNFEYQMEKKRMAYDNHDFYPVDCTCYGNQLVIQPDGQISNCPFYTTNFGHVKNIDNDFRIWNQQVIKYWRKRLPLYHEGVAKAINGGGCAWNSLELKNDLLAIDDASKIFSEEVLDEFVWQKCRKIL